jgi:integrase
MSKQTRPAPRAKSRRPLAVLIDEATEHLANLGYNPSTIAGHRAFWTRLAWMAGPDGLAAPLSKELAARFLASYGITPERIDDRLDSGPREARTAIRVLLEYDSEGRINRHRQPQLRPALPKRFERLIEEFAVFSSEQRGLRPRTVRYYCADARRFLLFLVNRKGSVRMNPEAVSDFLLSLKVQPVTIGHCAAAIRAFLRFLSAIGRIPADWLTFVPPLRVWQSARLAMPWTDEMLQRLFAAVDRGCAGGKRDYAMLLLAARLGLRVGEIRTLALRDVDWKRRCMTVRRTKGGPISELPVPQDILRALRDYVDRGRPPTSAATLFVRHAAPYEALSAKSNLHGMLCGYCRRAGIEQPEIYLHGMHSLRHAFATRLFRAETPIPTLAGLLGQRSPESPRAYLRIDIETLRRASFDPGYYCHA